MRGKFTDPRGSIHYYLVEWPTAALSWADFRGKVLGATNPAEAAKGSLRRAILDEWKGLGLAAEPDTGDNGVHASASPFEALSERINWCGATLEGDAYGRGLLAAGIDAKTLKAWGDDPQARRRVVATSRGSPPPDGPSVGRPRATPDGPSVERPRRPSRPGRTVRRKPTATPADESSVERSRRRRGRASWIVRRTLARLRRDRSRCPRAARARSSTRSRTWTPTRAWNGRRRSTQRGESEPVSGSFG